MILKWPFIVDHNIALTVESGRTLVIGGHKSFLDSNIFRVGITSAPVFLQVVVQWDSNLDRNACTFPY